MTKKICISGYYGFNNFGDETILKVLIENLKKFKNTPQITVFSSNPNKTSKIHNVTSVGSFNISSVIKELYNCDCLISGGGSLLQDVTSSKSLIYYIGIIALAQIFQKEVIIFAQGIGPINNKILKKITKFMLKKAKYITVRDTNSLNLLKQWGINAILCNDPVWNITINSKKQNNKIGIQLRSFPTITEEFLIKLAFCINKFYQDKEINILSLQNKLDLEICKKLQKHINAINHNIDVKVIENISNENIIENISQMESLIAMRYHACLIGIKSGAKVLPINYDIKVETLSKDFNLKYINIQSFDEMLEIFENFKNSTQAYNKEQIESLKFNFNELENNL